MTHLLSSDQGLEGDYTQPVFQRLGEAEEQCCVKRGNDVLCLPITPSPHMDAHAPSPSSLAQRHKRTCSQFQAVTY